MQNLTPGFVEQFSANIQLVLQQEGSKLQKCVRTETLDHESQFYNSIGVLEAMVRPKNADGYNLDADMDLRTAPMTRRHLTAQMVYWTAVFDRGDLSNTMLDPKSYYTKSAAWALGRQYDQTIIKAFTGTVAGKQPGANDDYNFGYATNAIPLTQPLNHDANGNLGFVDNPEDLHQDGLTINKLLDAREILTRKYNGEKLYVVCTSAQLSDLLKQKEIQNFDYNTVKALVAGEIDTFAGFKFITTELLPGYIGFAANAAIPNPLIAHGDTKITIRSCFAFAESAILFGKVKGAFLTKVDELVRRHYALQFYCSDSVGAIRMDEDGVVLINCVEAYRPAHLSVPGMTRFRGANLDAWNLAANAKHMISTDIVAP